MVSLNNTKQRATAQAGLRRELTEMFRAMAVDIDTVLQRYERRGADLKKEKTNLQTDISLVIQRYFVVDDGRTAFAGDGVTALTPYARILNKWYVFAVRSEVMAHYRWLQEQLPTDVFLFLSDVNTRRVIKEAVIPVDGDDFMAMIEGLRIFGNRQLEYDQMHHWVDPNGYDLSDRIWNANIATRRAVDTLVARAIQDGTGSLKLSKLLERYLVPGRAAVRTRYRGVTDTSFDAMRLARTEIARASNHAAYASAYLNPMVTGIDVARSTNGDTNCPICPKHATIDISGNRVREPYPIDKANIPPYHPQDMCAVRSVTGDTKEIVDLLRASIPRQLVPYTNPTSPNRLLRQLLGPVLFAWMIGELQLNG